MRWAIDIYNNLIKVPIKNLCNGYYLRWYYNGWHYWYFSPGQHNVLTEGEKYRTIGTRRITMGSRQVTREQAIGIRTIMYTREVYLLTIYGWKNIRIEPGSLVIYNSDITGADMEFTAIIGSKEISYDTGFTPVPAPIATPTVISITHLNHGIFTMTLTGNCMITIDWGDGSAPETFILNFADLVITHDYTGTTGSHVITIDGEECIITLEANGQQITEIIIPPTAVILTTLLLPNNLITVTPYIPPGLIITIIDLQGNPLLVCEVAIGTQVWMCKNYDSKYPGSKVYNDDEANRAIYGGLYKFTQIKQSGFCPPMWHIPTLAEWQALITYLGGDPNLVGGFLKEAGLSHWDTPNKGAYNGADNSSGFTALGGGLYSTIYAFLKEQANFWAQGYWIQLSNTSAEIMTLSGITNNYLNVRLIKDFATVIHPFNDWFLPSKDELNEMYTELHLFGVGGFTNDFYWSSSETDTTSSFDQRFSDGLQNDSPKNYLDCVRACRAFTSITIYALRDIGPAGGWIFWKSGNDYLEAAPIDQSADHAWSNIVDVEIGTTGTAIGTGQANTTAIIGQAGHTDSAAKLCNDFVI